MSGYRIETAARCWLTLVHDASDGVHRYLRAQRLSHDPLIGDHVCVEVGHYAPVHARIWTPAGVLVLDVGGFCDVRPDSDLPARLTAAGWELDPDDKLGLGMAERYRSPGASIR